MTIPILQHKVLLQPKDIEPICPEFDVVGTFNPAAVQYGNDIVLLVRVSEKPRQVSFDSLLSPRAVWEDGKLRWVTDLFDPLGADVRDPRKFWLPDGSLRLRFISHLRMIRLSLDGTEIKEVSTLPALLPKECWEELGVEDARITQIGDTFYITYVAVSRTRGVATALMTTRDFRSFKRHGVIFPTENKDVVFLPEKWRGYYVAYHRPVSDQRVNLPSIETALSPDTVYWGKYNYLFGPRPGEWDAVKVGAGPPPIRFPEGWLLLYHGVSHPTPESPVGRYYVGAALLDKENPQKLIARTKLPLIPPDRSYEQAGYVPNVIFPTGAILDKDQEVVTIFAGGADEVTSMLKVSVEDILSRLDAQ